MLRFSLALLGVVVIVLGILWMAGMLTWSTATPADRPEPEQNGPGVLVGKLTQPYRAEKLSTVQPHAQLANPIPDPIVITDGTFSPVEEAEVPSRVDGQLMQMFVRLGGRLQPGDLIAQLDDTLIRPEMETARVRAESTAKIEVAKLIRDYYDLEYKKALQVNRTVPNAVAQLEIKQKEVQRDQYEFEWQSRVDENRIARYEYESKRRQYELHQIRSPIAGEVTRIFKRPGEGIKAGETLIRVTNFDRLFVDGAVPLPLRHMVRPGMRVLVEPERQQGWLKELRGHTATVTGLCLTPDGRFLVSSGEDGRLVVWDWQFGAQRPLELRDSRFSREFGCVACSPVLERQGDAVTYTILAGGADGRLRQWRVEVASTGRIGKHTLSVLGEVAAIQRTPIRCLAISPDGKLVASGSEDGEICVTSLVTGRTLTHIRDPGVPREPAHRAAVTSLALLPEGDLVSASQDRTLARWRFGQDAKGNWGSELLWRIHGRSAEVAQLGISRDGCRALFETGEELRILDLSDGQTLAVISSRRSGPFRSVAVFSPDARQVLTTTAGGRLHVWNVPPSQEESAWLRLAYQRGFKYHTPMVLGALNTVLLPNWAAALPAWLALADPTLNKLPAPETILVNFSPNATLPAVPVAPTSILPELWPVDAREVRLYSISDPSSVTCAAFSPDGRFCFTGGTDKVIRVWPAPSLEETIRPLEGVLVYVGQQVEGAAGLVRIRAEMENPRTHSARLELGVRATITVLPDLRP